MIGFVEVLIVIVLLGNVNLQKKVSRRKASDINLLTPANNTGHVLWTFESCSLGRSSLVLNILDQEFFPVLSRHNVDVPVGCPFQLGRYVYDDIIKHKDLTGMHPKCDYCGKLFHNALYLDRHMQRKHSDRINVGDHVVCLESYCDIFRCHLHEQFPIVSADFGLCNASEIRQLQLKCQQLVYSCLPEDADKRHLVYDELYQSMCSTLTCEKFYLPFEDLSLLYVFGVCSLALAGSAFIVCLCYVFWEEVSIAQATSTKVKVSVKRDVGEVLYRKDFSGDPAGVYEVRNRKPTSISTLSRSSLQQHSGQRQLINRTSHGNTAHHIVTIPDNYIAAGPLSGDDSFEILVDFA